MSSGYTIADEPRPSGIAHVTVHPIWPFFSVMFVGVWLAWPWFILNAFAMGSPNRKKEILTAIGGVLGSFVIVLLIGLIRSKTSVDEWGINFSAYAHLAIIVWHLGISYYLFVLQAETFDLYTYFGGVVRNGLLVVIAGVFFGIKLMGPVFEAFPLLRLLIG